MRRVAWASTVVLVAAAIPIGLAAAAPGDLDPTFSGNGWVRTYDMTGFTGPYTAKGAEDLAIQPDGKIVAVGEIKNRGQLVLGALRWTSTGDLDRSFGDSGWATTHVGQVPNAHAVALQPDGKILVGGEVDFDLDLNLAGIARFNRDGSLDRSFGDGGVVHSPNAFGRHVNDVAVQRDGKIVTVGNHISSRDRQLAFAVSRYLPNGALDRSFSGDGRTSISFRSGHETAYAVALQRDGKIVVAGSAEYYEDDFAFARLRPNGKLDRTFSRDGLQMVRFGPERTDRVRSLVIQRNGRIVAAGDSRVLPRYEPSRMALIRLKANGALDRPFGKHLTSPVRNGGYARAVRVQADGRIVVAGLAYEDPDYSTSAWFLARYLRNGRSDPAFGRGGIVVSDFGTGTDWAGAIALQPDGRIVVGGSVYEDQAIARYRAG
ncbi:MAG: hypothetical protein AABM30_08970 [Actinomycetota bacterium]